MPNTLFYIFIYQRFVLLLVTFFRLYLAPLFNKSLIIHLILQAKYAHQKLHAPPMPQYRYSIANMTQAIVRHSNQASRVFFTRFRLLISWRSQSSFSYNEYLTEGFHWGLYWGTKLNRSNLKTIFYYKVVIIQVHSKLRKTTNIGLPRKNILSLHFGCRSGTVHQAAVSQKHTPHKMECGISVNHLVFMSENIPHQLSTWLLSMLEEWIGFTSTLVLT